MKFNLINTTVLASGLFVSSLALADSIAVQNDSIFLLGGATLSAQQISGTATSTACLDQLATQPINPLATDIVISGTKAVVAPGVAKGSAEVVNISACLTTTTSTTSSTHHEDEDEDEAKADLKKGTLTIPCLNVDGKYYNVQMKQRGSSSNWEVELGKPVAEGACVKTATTSTSTPTAPL